MNYYSHHIGDFDRATRHLTRIERSIYRDLLDVYYDTEQMLTLDLNALCRKIIARTNEEATAVEQVLNEFFTKTPNGWYHDRCEEELEAFKTSTSQKSIAGKASAAKREAKRQLALNGNPTAVEQPLNECGTAFQLTSNQEPITNNQEPKKAKAEAAPKARKPAKTAIPEDFSISDAIRSWAEKGGHANLEAHFDAFVRKAKANGYTYANWDQALQNAILDDWARLSSAPVRIGNQPRAAPPLNEKFHFNHLDRSGDIRAMEASMKRHNITVPAGDEEIKL